MMLQLCVNSHDSVIYYGASNETKLFCSKNIQKSIAASKVGNDENNISKHKVTHM